MKKRIALVVDYFEPEYTQRAFKGASDFLQKNDAELLLFQIGTINSLNFDYSYQDLAVASHLTLTNVDGMIFLTGTQINNVPEEYIRMYLKSFEPLPVVSVGSAFDGIPSILTSCKKSMEQLIEHLIKKHGIKDFALMALTGESQEARERQDTFMKVLKQHNIKFDKSKLIFGGFTYETAASALREYRKEKGRFDFDAIVALNDEMAFACMDVFKAEGISIPDDIIVTGFDDNIRASCNSPSLTSINQNVEEQLECAAKLILSIIEGKRTPAKKTINPTPVFRQSCGCVSPRNMNGTGFNIFGQRVHAPVKDVSVYGLNMWYTNKKHFVMIAQHYSSMKAEITLSELRRTINSDLVSYKINTAAICLFENPISTGRFEYFKMPDKARIFAAFDRENGYVMSHNAPEFVFNPNENMIPEGLFASMDGIYVCTLFNNSVIYGYMLFRPGEYDATIYTMVYKIAALSIANATTFSFSKSRINALETDYEKIKTVSMTDELTGLLNRRGFISIGSKMLETSKLTNQGGLILFGDIDGLKKINDTYGHAAGDTAIRSEAKLLKETFRSSDVVARLGGDEFSILASGLSVAKFKDIRNQLKEKCDEYNKTSGEPFTLSISIGYAPFGGEFGYDINSLLSFADETLYTEKKRKHKNDKNEENKINAKFFSTENTLLFNDGTKIEMSGFVSIEGKNCSGSFTSENNMFYTVLLPWSLVGENAENYNEEFLANLRDWLKLLEGKNSFAIMTPVIDIELKDKKADLIASFKHCARRIKDCTSVIGFSIPDAADKETFIKELSEKHKEYVFFSNDDSLLNQNEKIVKL